MNISPWKHEANNNTTFLIKFDLKIVSHVEILFGSSLISRYSVLRRCRGALGASE